MSALNLSKNPIYDHCFSQDRKTVAITKENDVLLFDVSGAKPSLITTLTHHDKPVTAVDISSDGKIVTCSQDRNALVWEPSGDGKTYKPTLVLLRINRAATCARWAPNGKKFAVGSSDRVVAICYYEAENDWWISKHLKKPLRSTILSVDWHPNNVLLACGSADGHVRVFSTYIKSVDSKPDPSVWGERLPFQTLCADYISNSGGSWIHDVSFSPGAEFLAFVSHDGNVNIVYPSPPVGSEPGVPAAYFEVRTRHLPFKSLTFINDNKLVAGGFDAHPVVFEGSEQGWQLTKSIDDPTEAKKHVQEEQSAIDLFKSMDLKGKSGSKFSESLPTIHQNSITKVKLYSPNSISTSGNDGKVVVFKV
ncbi:Actin-related protein 2/3 complex subunit 1 [Komagataella phaffii CBS 7435]|uniref:Actin-related protein 2/3 complex subunit n=2 Tax=Komagataella phaffii TaxID=460519 RepID=C4R254_KOMPG|nr:Subunit of the ARP2/3 complex [Komagataella phaffii GS115]AOA62639.1 GQ67_00999T0 [Komagataella phaffii]CAH2447874.1 Actin-related protein 2/3 complex subunit 1 [Komagataella phaffii CBS 7435]AOA67724.1 GQ68_00390T0 [Komagataella phaffii GS115]CAY69578.1 Subunit of the ARP2/3 complex [Komagataella phaffii GS115]CCA38042.1 Actin-related protein 2/3 complex subunit 1 [Komagataella phaffii CBS 7435]